MSDIDDDKKKTKAKSVRIIGYHCGSVRISTPVGFVERDGIDSKVTENVLRSEIGPERKSVYNVSVKSKNSFVDKSLHS